VKNANGSFLVLEHGSIQRLEAGRPDPRIVTFDRYAFDLSKFTGGPQNVMYTVREKYLWELMWPAPNDQLYATQADQYRSEMYDRLSTPFYPVAFAILTYMFLGPPQTTRQSRTLALLGLIATSTALRLAGFVSVIVGVRTPAMLSLQFIALGVTIVGGLIQIGRGKTIEHAAVTTRIASAITERIVRATA
jgi:lipopolysaccharide export system permease protein